MITMPSCSSWHSPFDVIHHVMPLPGRRLCAQAGRDCTAACHRGNPHPQCSRQAAAPAPAPAGPVAVMASKGSLIMHAVVAVLVAVYLGISDPSPRTNLFVVLSALVGLAAVLALVLPYRSLDEFWAASKDAFSIVLLAAVLAMGIFFF